MRTRSISGRWLCRLSACTMAALAAALLLGACGTLQVGVERPSATGAMLAASTATAAAEPASPSPTMEPSPTPPVSASPAPAATPEPPPTASPATVDRVKIYLVALEDNGLSGKQIGCGDSVVAVERQVPPTREPLRAALEQLFSLHEQYYGQSGLYNALYQANLKVESVAIEGSKATVQLAGQYTLGGVCDSPRFDAQIRETVLQFPEVQEAAIFVNGAPLEQVLSLR